ncbi:MAG: iron-containing alcohol dehydrogenase [Planctomycetia bacterium]|nr:iron-containing alcohol dehydrogenase [Planctomycetia bacterium]
MAPFDYLLQTRLVFGPNRIEQLGDLAKEFGGSRVLVVSDPGIIRAGHTARGVDALHKAGLETLIYSDVGENPTTEHVERGTAVAREFRPDLVVGLGGGSSMDCAKGINFVYSCGGRMQDYWGIGKATKPMLPMIAVPTTAGTGSEAQSFALISDAETHVKMACGDKKAACKVALLDPTLTVTQPTRVTALTGIDAVAHALETYVTTKRNFMSILLSREAWRLLEKNFLRVLREPDDLDARGKMQLGAFLAGTAIENSMLGATHALANPLTAHFGIPHGQAIALMLPHVIRFNGEQHRDWYCELLAYVSGTNGAPSVASGPAGLADFLAQMVDTAGLAGKLSACDVDEGILPQMAADAAKQWTGTFNPRPLTTDDFLALYRAAY